MERYCKKCGNLLIDGAKFCGACGTPIEEAALNQEDQKKEETKAKMVAMANISTGGSMYHRESAMRDAGKSRSDFKNAARKLKALKNLKADTQIPQDVKETNAEFYEKNYDPALDDMDSLEHWSGFRNEDGSYSD